MEEKVYVHYPSQRVRRVPPKSNQRSIEGMQFIQPNFHLVESRGEQNVGRAPVVYQDSLDVEVGDDSGYYQGIIMGQMQTY